MSEHNVATAHSREEADPLADLRAAVTFAEELPEAYRQRAFELALGRVLGGHAVVSEPASPSVSDSPVTPIVTGGLARVAREIGVDPRLLARVVEVSEDGKVSILG